MTRSWLYVLGSLALAAALILVGRKILRDRTAPQGTASPEVTRLEGSLDPLRDLFNQDTGLPRFVALLSPT